MSKKALKKDPEIAYRQVDLGGVAVPALDRAFDILFEEVLRRRELNNKNIHKEPLTADDN
ncbi:MAG: hypothetical protein ABIG65_01615 [Patescibacteria group bacterium]